MSNQHDQLAEKADRLHHALGSLSLYPETRSAVLKAINGLKRQYGGAFPDGLWSLVKDLLAEMAVAGETKTDAVIQAGSTIQNWLKGEFELECEHRNESHRSQGDSVDWGDVYSPENGLAVLEENQDGDHRELQQSGNDAGAAVVDPVTLGESRDEQS